MTNPSNNLIKETINQYKMGNISNSKKIALNILKNYPKNLDANYILGIIANDEENYIDAINYFNLVIKVNDKDPEVWNYKAIALSKKGDFELAINNFERALNLGSIHKEKIFNNIIISIFNQNGNQRNKDYSKAILYAKKVLEIDDQNISALSNLGLAYLYELKITEAIKLFEKILKINPHLPNTYTNLGLAYRFKSNYELSEINYKKSLKVKDDDRVREDLGWTQLSQLKFSEGWNNLLNYTFNFKDKFLSNSPVPLWNPNFGFNHILIWGQYGLGEQILFSSIIPELSNKFKQITFMVEKRLVKLMRNSFPNITIIEKSTNIDLKIFDYHLPITSLGLYFRKSLNDFKPQSQILRVNKINNQKRKKLKCAISWKSINPEIGSLKSLDFESLKYLTSLLEKHNIDFYNIQYTNEDSDIEKLKNENNISIKMIENLDTLNDINELAEFINDCDFTINISNTNAHLSAALNKKSYLLLSKGAGTIWYWENDIDGKNIWYPSIHKIKQTEEGSWNQPIDELILAIKKDFPYNF